MEHSELTAGNREQNAEVSGSAAAQANRASAAVSRETRAPRHACGPAATLFFAAGGAPSIRRSFFKSRVPREENEIHAPGRPVALLGDNQLGLRAIFFRQISLVKIRP